MALLKRVRVIWTGVAGSPGYSNFYAVTADADASSFHSAVGDFIFGMCGWVVDNCVATVLDEIATIDSATGDILSVNVLNNIVHQGQSVTEMLPPASQVVVGWGTDDFVSGRRVQGRTYFPYITQGASEEGNVDPTVRAAMQGYVNEFILASEGDFAIWAKTSGGAAQVTSGDVKSYFGVMRSRRGNA